MVALSINKLAEYGLHPEEKALNHHRRNRQTQAKFECIGVAFI